MVTLGDKLKALRGSLALCEPRDGVRAKSFVERRVYDLGLAFFPAGSGCLDQKRTSVSCVVLGSDWGNEDSLAGLLGRSSHEDEKTYVGCRSMMVPAGFDLEDCFFTNAWPLLRSDNMNEVKHHPMRDDAALTAACRNFFAATLAELKPRLVITLGKAPAWFVDPFVGPNWKLDRFKSPKKMRSGDLPPEPVRAQSRVVFVAATHPSRIANVRHRGMTVAAEQRLLCRARSLAQTV